MGKLQEEPRPIEGAILFEESDFRALAPGLCANPDYNAHRLAARRRLLALGKRTAAAADALGLALECRTSLHHPHQFNGNRVSRLWAYLVEPEQLEEYLRHYTPGDHRLAVERRYPAPEGNRGGALASECAGELEREALRLVPLYRYAAWSQESDFLLAGR